MTIEAFHADLTDIQVHGLRADRAPSKALTAAPPLVLLHGWPEWSHAWRPVMSRLADRFTLIAPDFRGFGKTRQPTHGPSAEAGPRVHAADVLALADQLGLPRFGLVAHDVGSYVAQAIARQAPHRLTGLFFFNCGHPGIGSRWGEARHLRETWYQYFHQQPWAAELVGSSREACRVYFRHFLRHWSHQQAWIEGELEHWVDNFMQPGNLDGGFDWYRSVYELRIATIEGRVPPATPITVPTRVLWGAHDPVLKAAWIDRLGETFTNLEAGVEPDAGHFVHLEQPERAAHAIAAFFERVGVDMARR